MPFGGFSEPSERGIPRTLPLGASCRCASHRFPLNGLWWLEGKLAGRTFAWATDGAAGRDLAGDEARDEKKAGDER